MTGRAHRRRRATAGAIFVIGLGGILIAGLFSFVGKLPRQVENPDGKTGAIVVLTGGSERLAAGLALLSQGQAEKLFISGVDRGTSREAIRARAGAADRFECCVVIGRDALNTEGNARETAAWLKAQGYGSLRVVTASYHMPRSLLEMRRAMPGVALVSHPVFPRGVKIESWWRSPGTASLLLTEAAKYWAATVRTWLSPGPAPAA
ncbi:MAG: YdcF family protein [Proteobacteria bacterium]|nr:YdcF family protein [Pseudomonadota bacterium]